MGLVGVEQTGEGLQWVTPVAKPTLAFIPDRRAQRPALDVRVNFGIFTGRAPTPAEIDRLAEWLLDIVEAVTIVSEERHEIGGGAEAAVHQVRVELASAAVVPYPAEERRELEDRLLARCDYWVRECIESHRIPDSM
jgi:hypothetical protein